MKTRKPHQRQTLTIPEQVHNALCQWGHWARYPQRMINLRPISFHRLLGLPDEPCRDHDVYFDRQSICIQRAFERMRCEKSRSVIFCYYVLRSNYKKHEDVFSSIGVSKPYFYKLLRAPLPFLIPVSVSFARTANLFVFDIVYFYWLSILIC